VHLARVLGLTLVALVLPSCSKRNSEARARTRKEPSSEVRAVFVDPEDEGNKIDQCLSRGQRCGQPAADYYCRLNGFARADEFATISGAFSTIGLADMSPACDGALGTACVGFELIVCTEPMLPSPE